MIAFFALLFAMIFSPVDPQLQYVASASTLPRTTILAAHAPTATPPKADAIARVIAPVPVPAAKNTPAPASAAAPIAEAGSIPDVPFLSQFADISSPAWKKIGCGVTSLAMVIGYYEPDTVSVDTLLQKGIKQGAYLNNAGWTYAGLIKLSQEYGLDGSSYDLSGLTADASFARFKSELANGPVIASIHYKFDPKSTIPHLVVINGIDGSTIHYNDPAAKEGDKTISIADFQKGWKKRFIVVRPA